MAEEGTPITHMISSGLETEVTAGDGLAKTTTTPPSVADVVTHHSSPSSLVGSGFVGALGEKRVPGERLMDVRSRLHYPSLESILSPSGTVGSLFSSPGISAFPLTSFTGLAQSSASQSSASQSSLLSSVTGTPSPQLGYSSAAAALSLGGDASTSLQSVPVSSQQVVIQENHLVELLRLAAQATQQPPPPPPPPLSGSDWLSQLTVALRPTPPPPPPPPTGMEFLFPKEHKYALCTF